MLLLSLLSAGADINIVEAGPLHLLGFVLWIGGILLKLGKRLLLLSSAGIVQFEVLIAHEVLLQQIEVSVVAWHLLILAKVLALLRHNY